MSKRSAYRKARQAASEAHYAATQAATYGPVGFRDQPANIRARGRKGKARRGRSSGRGSRVRRSGGGWRASSMPRRYRGSTRVGRGWWSDYKLGLGYRIRGPKGLRKTRRRRWVANAAITRNRRTRQKRIGYSDLRKILKRSGLRSWACAGPRYTGCGTPRRRYGASRQLGRFRY